MIRFQFATFGFLSLLLISSCHNAIQPGEAMLHPGDNWQIANDKAPPGTVFLISSGVHQFQSVHNPKPGNVWIAQQGAVMDGGGKVHNAFSGEAYNVAIEGLYFKNYSDNAIYFHRGKNIFIDRIKVTNVGSGNGEYNGSVRLDRVENITVTNSHFESVSAGALASFCKGPVNISWNTGINTGRNFVQLRECEGDNIRIEYNSMERRGSYLRHGAEDVADWISIYKSNGEYDDPIRIRYNRARGHGNSTTGSFIMLGDGGGKYQVAKGNIGVTPGQVGIGIAGGHHIIVDENLLYSDEWDDSNVAIYSADFDRLGSCSNHIIRKNRSNWLSKGQQNNIWTEGNCEVLLEDNIHPDHTLDENIWYKFKGR